MAISLTTSAFPSPVGTIWGQPAEFVKMILLLLMDIYYWFDVFNLLQRRQLAELVIRLGNREFSEICQKWLHEKGRIDLSPIWIGKRTNGLAYVSNYEHRIVPFPDVPMPENIKGFKEIALGHVDDEVLQFLRRLQPILSCQRSSLKLDLWQADVWQFKAEAMRIIGRTLPLLAIKSLRLGNLNFGVLFPATFYQVTAIHLSIWVLPVASEPILLQWLHTRRADGAARIFVMYGEIPQSLIDGIRHQFLATDKEAVSFIVYIHDQYSNELENTHTGITLNAGEQLIIQKKSDVLLIGRCSAEIEAKWWMAGMTGKAEEIRFQKTSLIHVDAQPFICEEEEDDDDDQPGPSNKEAKEDEDKPGPSKKQKLF